MEMPGTTVGGGPAVLEDPTGRRARWLRRAGRLVFVLFLVWLLAIVLGGLGLAPVAGIPLTHVLRPSSGPPPVVKATKPRQPSASDLRPALPAPAGNTSGQAPSARSLGRSSPTPGSSGVTHGKSTTAPGQTKATPGGDVSHGKSTTAPGKTKTKTKPTPSPPARKP